MADYTPGPTRGLKGPFLKDGRALGALPECPALPGLPLEMSIALMRALKDSTPDTEPHVCVPESGMDFILAWSWRLCFWRRVGAPGGARAGVAGWGARGSTGVPAGPAAQQRILTPAPSPSVLLPPLWDSGCLCTWPGSSPHRACGVHCGGPSSTRGPGPHRGLVDFVRWVNLELVSEGPVGPLEVGDWPPLSETPVGGRGGPDVGVVRKLRQTLCLILKF